MATVHQVSDYIIHRLTVDENSDLSVLKHQKLLYYVQAWHLAFCGERAFDGEFQAWVHGPVNREIYDVYKESKHLYSSVDDKDIQNLSVAQALSDDSKSHIDTVLDVYAKYSATQLEWMTHQEKPWIEARKGFGEFQRCENVISDTIMQEFYASLIEDGK